MKLFGRFWFGVFCDDPGDPGAGGDPSAHPEYDLDTLDDNAGGADDDPSRQVAAPAGRQPVQAPARQPGQQPPAGGAPGPDGGTPQTYTAEQYGQVVTGYRTLQTQNQQLQGQMQLLSQQVAALTGLRQPGAPGPDGQPTPQFSEKDQAAIAAVHRLFPGLKPLLDKAQDLLALPEAVNGFRQSDQARWQDVGTRMWEAFDGAVKAAYGNRQLHEFAQRQLDAGFLSWLETDKNAAARYRLGDTSLAAEFMRMYRNGVIVPAQQATAPGQPPGAPRRPGQQPQPARVPRGGAGSAPVVGQPSGQPNARTADQLHNDAADAYFAARG